MANDIPTVMANSKGKTILLRMKNKKTVQGTLRDFDIHMNLTLEAVEDITGDKPIDLGTVLIRGDNILIVSIPTSGD